MCPMLATGRATDSDSGGTAHGWHQVTPEQLAGLSGNVARGAGDIDGTLNSLRDQVAPIVGGDWAGQASGQFSALFEQWQRSARELNTALQGIGTLLANASRAYTGAEQQIGSSFQQGPR